MRRLRHIPFVRLSVILVILFLFTPAIHGSFADHFMNLMFLGAILSTATAVSDRKSSRVLYRVVGAVVFTLFAVACYSRERIVLFFAEAFYLAIFIVLIVHVIRAVLESDGVGAARIGGAISAFLLAGLAWGLAYDLLDYMSPEAFVGGHDFDSSELIYFSLVTLSTLGYGDIVPQTDFARSLAALEAIFGQLYLAVLVALLVGSHAGRRTPAN